jgi:RNA polymerase-binding transcription factor
MTDREGRRRVVFRCEDVRQTRSSEIRERDCRARNPAWSRTARPERCRKPRLHVERERARLLRTVVRTDDELATLEAHQPGAPAEDATSEVMSTVLSRLAGREKHDLDEIDAARARLEAGTFGACEACHRPIPLARLRARPATRYCRDCQARIER